jgi:hypothetical protein
MSDKMRYDWGETQATVWSVVQERRPGETDSRASTPVPFHVYFSYTVNGEYYSGDFFSPTPLEKDSKLDILYDPADPSKNNLTEDERKYEKSMYIMWGVGAILFVLFCYFRACK